MNGIERGGSFDAATSITETTRAAEQKRHATSMRTYYLPSMVHSYANLALNYVPFCVSDKFPLT